MKLLLERLNNHTIRLSTIAFWLALAGLALVAVACTDAAQSSFQGQQTAIDKWGSPGNGITNFYEYKQLQDIYTLRDNQNLVLNAYLFSQTTGKLFCLGKVKGFGIPYGTQMSPPTSNGSPVPEPNALFPSQTTNADWVQLIDPTTGKVHVSFVEPDMIITDETLPCTPLS